MTSTADECMAVFTDWAHHYPSARFVVVAVADDGTDAEALGWGLALPDLAFTYLPELRLSGRFNTAHELTEILRTTVDARIIWVDPEPEYWPEDPDDEP